MRIKGNNRRSCLQRTGAFDHRLQYHPVTEMNAVEVADTHDGVLLAAGEFVEVAENLHGQFCSGAISKVSCRPSCASRMSSGSDAFVASWSRSWLMCVK